MHYPLDLIRPDEEGPLDDTAPLLERPFSGMSLGLKEEASLFEPGEALTTAMNAAIALGEPLLATGEPGTGKTQAAYYAGWKLNTEVFHFQVKSETTARDLLYHFNTVRYFHDAQIHRIREEIGDLDKWQYVERQILWQAFDYGAEKGRPAVVLIDEIDKAPRDFPNDLLHELSQMSFRVIETQEEIPSDRKVQPILFITSNSERRLPEPFLRRCVYHHIEFDDAIVHKAVKRRQEHYKALGDGLLELAIRRFLAVRDRNLRKLPATGELLVWLRILALALEGEQRAEIASRLKDDSLGKLPFLGVLLKDHKDLLEIGGQ